jgi:hypothetical protein
MRTEWERRVQSRRIFGELAQQGEKFADQAYWELLRCGFRQFRSIDEDWGQRWRDSIERTEFSPRAHAFIEWLKLR